MKKVSSNYLKFAAANIHPEKTIIKDFELYLDNIAS